MNLLKLRVGNMINYQGKFTGTKGEQELTEELYKHLLKTPEEKELVSGIELTQSWIERLGGYELSHFKMVKSLILPLNRNRYLSFGHLNTDDEICFITEVDSDDNNKITDLVCLHNRKDGKLTVHKIQNFYFEITNSEPKLLAE